MDQVATPFRRYRFGLEAKHHDPLSLGVQVTVRIVIRYTVDAGGDDAVTGEHDLPGRDLADA
jgi:hypothetical protein